MGGAAKLEVASFRVAEFSDVLDWRPMLFQEPVIAQRACALCGVVYKTAVRLPCAHTLCTKCLAQCVDKGGACPVDQGPFCEEDLEKLELSAEYILKRKVACWNASSGCGFVGTTASLLDHYKECGLSVVPCCLCRSSVLQCDILEHFKNGCSIHEAKCVPSNSPATEDLKDMSTAYIEMKRAVGRISEDLMSLQTSLNRCSEDVKVEDEKCRVQWKAEASTFHVEIKRLAEQLKDFSTICTTEVPEAMQVALEAVMADYKKHVSKELRLLSLSKPTRVHWYIEGWELRKRDAVYRRLCSPTSNMYGYNVSQEVTLKQKDEEVSLGCFMVIHPGDHDLQLEWPFRKVYTLGVIHPKDPSNVISCKINAVNCGDNLEHCFLRPKGRKANVGYGNGNLTTVRKLETNGFIQSDTLHMFLEIEP
uniref:Putative tnf receptor-associated factor n=1 Tax=Ixodes ricinus TaxID=34613 RepID=A0A6B0VDE9_IXORI